MTETITQVNSEQDAKSKVIQKNDLLEQLSQPEVQASLTNLIEQLPKLTELVNTTTQAYEFMQLVMTDEVLKKDTFGAIADIVDPVKGSVKNIAATAIEAKDRAEESNEVIGLFGLLRMMKDPQAQKLFRFLSAYLEVAQERSSQK